MICYIYDMERDIRDGKEFTIKAGTFKLTGVSKIGGEWFVSVKKISDTDPSIWKDKPWSWMLKVNARLNEKKEGYQNGNPPQTNKL